MKISLQSTGLQSMKHSTTCDSRINLNYMIQTLYFQTFHLPFLLLYTYPCMRQLQKYLPSVLFHHQCTPHRSSAIDLLTLTVLVTHNWCTATLWNRIMTAQCEGMGEVGSARYQPALLPPCPSIRALCYSNCQRSTQSHQQLRVKIPTLISTLGISTFHLPLSFYFTHFMIHTVIRAHVSRRGTFHECCFTSITWLTVRLSCLILVQPLGTWSTGHRAIMGKFSKGTRTWKQTLTWSTTI